MSDLMTEENVRKIFDGIVEPKLKWNINILNLLKNIKIVDKKVIIEINLITQETKDIEAFSQTVKNAVQRLGFEEVNLKLGRVDVATEGLKNVKHIIFVGAGKGGVGKSSVSVNLAVSLKQRGFEVGLMDADIHGPSVPTMMGIKERPEVLTNEYLSPVIAHGVKCCSIGCLVEDGSAIDWRGQVLSGTLIQFIQKTLWGKLDYLIIDLPPGTGDTVLTLIHKIKASGAVLVTTPSDVSLADLKRTVTLFRNSELPILGVVENMTHLICSSCNHQNLLFPKNKFKDTLIDYNLEELVQLPLVPNVSNLADLGRPFVLDEGMVALKSKFDYLTSLIIDKTSGTKSVTVKSQTNVS